MHPMHKYDMVTVEDATNGLIIAMEAIKDKANGFA